MEKMKLLYSRAEACTSLGISLRSLEGLIDRGELAVVAVGPRRKLIRASDLEAFVRKATTKKTPKRQAS
jgi:excisionase family DNA binding protein